MKGIVFLGLALGVCLVLGGCQKDLSERLAGKWQLKKIEQDGQIVHVDTVWYNFQSESLFLYQVYDPRAETFSRQLGYKSQPEEHTILLALFSNPRPVTDFIPLTDWQEKERRFVVLDIGGGRLVLSSDNKTYHFIRF
jgi:hypothetical protein